MLKISSATARAKIMAKNILNNRSDPHSRICFVGSWYSRNLPAHPLGAVARLLGLFRPAEHGAGGDG